MSAIVLYDFDVFRLIFPAFFWPSSSPPHNVFRDQDSELNCRRYSRHSPRRNSRHTGHGRRRRRVFRARTRTTRFRIHRQRLGTRIIRILVQAAKGQSFCLACFSLIRSRHPFLVISERITMPVRPAHAKYVLV